LAPRLGGEPAGAISSRRLAIGIAGPRRGLSCRRPSANALVLALAWPWWWFVAATNRASTFARAARPAARRRTGRRLGSTAHLGPWRLRQRTGANGGFRWLHLGILVVAARRRGFAGPGSTQTEATLNRGESMELARLHHPLLAACRSGVEEVEPRQGWSGTFHGPLTARGPYTVLTPAKKFYPAVEQPPIAAVDYRPGLHGGPLPGPGREFARDGSTRPPSRFQVQPHGLVALGSAGFPADAGRGPGPIVARKAAGAPRPVGRARARPRAAMSWPLYSHPCSWGDPRPGRWVPVCWCCWAYAFRNRPAGTSPRRSSAGHRVLRFQA